MVDGHTLAIVQDAANFSALIPDGNLISPSSSGHHYLDMLVENMGREIDLDPARMRKGIGGDSRIKLDGEICGNLTIYSVDFEFLKNFSVIPHFPPLQLQSTTSDDHDWVQETPTLYFARLTIEDASPRDTYLRLPGWDKGCVFVNGFNVGRYWSVGPQQTLYIPGTLLRSGLNWIQVFELHRRGKALHFLDRPILG